MERNTKQREREGSKKARGKETIRKRIVVVVVGKLVLVCVGCVLNGCVFFSEGGAKPESDLSTETQKHARPQHWRGLFSFVRLDCLGLSVNDALSFCPGF